jgi:hypothetical protein
VNRVPFMPLELDVSVDPPAVVAPSGVVNVRSAELVSSPPAVRLRTW